MTQPDLDITLDGTHFRLRQPLSYTNLATLAPKVVFGDYTQDNNELLSTWVMSDLTGGHGIADLMPADSNRYRWAAGIYTRFPSQWSMPYRITESADYDDGQYQPLCDGVMADNDGDQEWRHFALAGRRIYIDNVEASTVAITSPTQKSAASPAARATNKGVVFKGNGSRQLLFIPHGQDGYTLFAWEDNDKIIWKMPFPQFVGFCLYDNKVVGVDDDGQLWQCIRSNDKLGNNLNNSSDTTVNISAADRKYSVNSVIQINGEQMKVTAVTKTNVTVTRGHNGTNKTAHSSGDLIYGQWKKYDLKSKLHTGYDVRDVIVYNDQNSQPAVHIITDRDVWAFDEAGPTLFRTSLSFPQKPNSGVGSAVWRGDLYVSGGMDIYRWNGDVMSNIGLSRDDGLPRNYQGYVADLAAGPNGLYALVKGRTDNANEQDYWSVHEWSGAGWHTVWAEAMGWGGKTINDVNLTLGAAITTATQGKASNTYITFNTAGAQRMERGDILRINNEDVRVKKRISSTQITALRGVNGTNATTHSNGDRVYRKRSATFIMVSQAYANQQRLIWGVGDRQFYQQMPAEATNPREDVEVNADNAWGFGFGGRTGTTYSLFSGRFDAQMPGYIKIANGLEMRIRRLPFNQVLRVYYRKDEKAQESDWKKLGVVAGGDKTSLAAAVTSAGQTSITLADVQFIEAGMYLRVGSEVMTVTAVNKTTKVCTVSRGSGATTYSNGATVKVDFRIGDITSGRQIWRFGSYADNNNVFKGVPFHSIEFKVVVTDQMGNVIVTSAMPSQLTSGVVTEDKVPEDDDQFLANTVNETVSSKDTFIIEHMAFSFLKVRSASGSWVADIDLSEPWMDKSPEELADKLDDLLQAQRFFSFRHRDRTYRVRLAQVTGTDSAGFDERSSRRINIVEIPITLGPLGNW